MIRSTKLVTSLGAVLVFGAVSCAPQVSRPVTERERTAAIGGLGGGALGAIIGSFAGSAVAGGLFGIPLGAVAGWYVGDQYDVAVRRDQDRDSELERLRRENERLRRESDDIRRPSAEAPAASGAARSATAASDAERAAAAPSGTERSVTAPSGTERSASATTAGAMRAATQPDEIRQAQAALNQKGFNAGPQDGIWGPETESAVRSFQKSRGIEVTGRLDERTMKELGIAERSGTRQSTSGSASSR